MMSTVLAIILVITSLMGTTMIAQAANYSAFPVCQEEKEDALQTAPELKLNQSYRVSFKNGVYTNPERTELYNVYEPNKVLKFIPTSNGYLSLIHILSALLCTAMLFLPTTAFAENLNATDQIGMVRSNVPYLQVEIKSQDVHAAEVQGKLGNAEMTLYSLDRTDNQKTLTCVLLDNSASKMCIRDRCVTVWAD